MRSYSKPEHVPNATRQKHLDRPLPYGRRSLGRKKQLSNFMTVPTNPDVDDKTGRTNHYGTQRRDMKLARSPEQLLLRFNKAVSNKAVDASVVAAAMQTCGYQRWWGALSEVRAVQKASTLRLNQIARNIYITALTRAASGSKYGVVPERRQELLKLAKEAWYEVASV